MDRLLLIRHGVTAETRHAGFPTTSGATADEDGPSLDRAGLADAVALRRHLPEADRAWSSHAVCAVETAQACGYEDPECTADLAARDVGTWAGRSLAEIHAADPVGFSRWHHDPRLAPHGGEGLDRVRVRARRVLDRAATLGGTTVAVSHGELVRAALLEVLDLPADALWTFDAAPCSVTELHPRSHGQWRIVLVGWRPDPYRRSGARHHGLRA
jgi:broad specificity phosphatase PhoE